METRTISLLILMIFSLESLAQESQNHEKKIFKDEDGKVYVNRDLPVYLSISTNRDGSDGEVLEGQDPTYSSPMYLDSEGYNSIRSPWQVDPETKKVVYPKKEVIFELYADSKSPITKIDFKSASVKKSKDLVMMKSGTVSFSAKDEISGVEAVYYSIDNAPFKKYQDTIKLSEEKATLIKYYAVDNVGNIEDISSVNIVVDNSAPTSTLDIDGDKFDEVLSARSTIVLTAKDGTSEKSRIFYKIDEGKTYNYFKPVSVANLSEGEHTITYFSVDDVDNNEEKKSFNFFIDKSAPRVIDEIIGNTFVANGKEYYSGRTKLKLVAMDNKAGVKEIRYSVNGGEFKLYESPFYLTEQGNLNIEVLVIDQVNNRVRTSEFSDKNSLINYVDLAGPMLNHSIVGPSFTVKDTIYISKDTQIKLSGSDDDSGFKEIDYQIDNGTSIDYSEPFSIPKEGFHTITYNGYDNLSNSSSGTIVCVVDNDGPEVYNRFSINSSESKLVDGENVTVYPSHVLLFLSSTDKNAGLDKISYQVNGGTTVPYRSLIENFRKNKLYRITASVVDKLGNENQEEIVFYIE